MMKKCAGLISTGDAMKWKTHHRSLMRFGMWSQDLTEVVQVSWVAPPKWVPWSVQRVLTSGVHEERSKTAVQWVKRRKNVHVWLGQKKYMRIWSVTIGLYPSMGWRLACPRDPMTCTSWLIWGRRFNHPWKVCVYRFGQVATRPSRFWVSLIRQLSRKIEWENSGSN